MALRVKQDKGNPITIAFKVFIFIPSGLELCIAYVSKPEKGIKLEQTPCQKIKAINYIRLKGYD
jgi:hypothetical protein